MTLNTTEISAGYSAIRGAQRILVLPHANVDPDGLSSALAVYAVLKSIGKDVTVICPDTLPESLNFLPGFSALEREVHGPQNFVITIDTSAGVEVDKLRYTVEDQKVNIIVTPKHGTIDRKQISLGEGALPYDLIIAVDTADLPLMGSVYTGNIDLFSSVPILNIDHHVSNTHYGQWKLISTTAASATEVLYGFFTQVPDLRGKITPDIATLLLTGLITDTRSFQNPNTTPRSLEIAAELLELGARQQEIIQHIYKTKPLSTLKIWGRALNGIQIDPSARIVWSSISKEDLAEMGATSKETHGILDELISTIPDADVHVLFTEVEEGGLKASMRSSDAIDASALAGQLFGGGGHPRAAGFRIPTFSNFPLQVLECVSKLKDGVVRQLFDARDGTGGTPASAGSAEEKKDKKKTPAGPVGPVRPVSPVSPVGQGTRERMETKEQKVSNAVDPLEEMGGGEQKGDGTDVVEKLTVQKQP